ncbi:hypothetical protein FHG87_017004 [Trinorchestia longiramus]|nr:hypothetical protein FHG87_017004 [Trinorchestia longiramus]
MQFEEYDGKRQETVSDVDPDFERARLQNKARIKQLMNSKEGFQTSRSFLGQLLKSCYSLDLPEKGSKLDRDRKTSSAYNVSGVEPSDPDAPHCGLMKSSSVPHDLTELFRHSAMSTSLSPVGAGPGSSSITSSKGLSRLGQMQAKLQEQLMVEKESRLLQMAARQEAERDNTIQRVTKSSASSLSSSLSSLSLGSSMSGQGRVRRLFEDRRSTGYDKSYPLNPVKGKSSDAKPPVRGVVKSGTRNPPGKSAYGGGYGQPRSRSQVSSEQRVPKQSHLNRQNNNTARGMARLGLHKSNPSLLDTDNNPNNNNNNNSRFGGRPSRDGASPAPTVNGRGPSPLPPSTAPQRRPPPRKFAPSPVKSKPSPSPSPKPPSTPYEVKLPASLAPSPFPVRRGSTASVRPPQKTPVPPGMKRCPVCERNFNEDRIEKHTTICQKTANRAKKRKAFDPVKMRNKGTEAEKYIARGLHLKEVKTKKKDWRKQHEDFIKTVRAAKGMKGYEAPPLDVSDYVQCPHCGRKFNQSAADRHIPKCSDIKSNKPSGGKRR